MQSLNLTDSDQKRQTGLQDMNKGDPFRIMPKLISDPQEETKQASEESCTKSECIDNM